MEGEVAAAELQDWEVLVNSDTDLANSPTGSVDNTRKSFEEIEAESEGMLRLDYFSLENDNRYSKKPVVDCGSEEGSVESGNPSWIDPGSETRYQRTNSGEFWSDSGSDPSEDRRLGDFNAKNELGFAENAKTEVGFLATEDKVSHLEGKGELGFVENVKSEMGFPGIGYCGAGEDNKFTHFEGKSELGCFEDSVKSQVGSGGLGESGSKGKELAKFWSDSGGDDLVSGDVGKVSESAEIHDESEGQNVAKEENLSVVAAVEERKQVGEEEKRKVVWWKVPLEVLRFCVFRVSPVWSFSVAAAVMGFVILGRRLYKMKRKTRSLELKVTVDDKKVSQFMSRAARLNEAFSVVRRVPIVRPLLPAAGLNPWPVMSLR